MIKNVFFSAIIIAAFSFNPGCRKTAVGINSNPGFILSSPVIGTDSLLPLDYTCRGSSSSLPLSWRGVPEGTVSLALVMYHFASPTDIHCYWIIYDIPAETDSLTKNATGIGKMGINSVNGKMQYTPPCSQGPGLRDYCFTLYALSGHPQFSIEPDSVNRSAILNAIKDITISSATLKVYYTW